MRAIDLGVIFFRQTGHARWEAMPILADGLSRVMVGLSQRMASKVGVKLGPLEQSGDWSLSRVVPAGTAQDRLGAIVKLPKPEEQIRNVRIFGGFRSLGEWLGRPSFLPNVAADASGLAIAPRDGVNDGTIWCEEKVAGTYAIRSEKPLDGPYVVQPAADEDRASPSWSRSMTFARDAHVHQSLAAAKGTPVAEWSDVMTMRDKVASPVDGWSEIDCKLDDLLEAVYAGGSSGWNEGELVPMLSDVLSGGASPWDVLRGLQEATMLEPYLKPGWKGRTWMLRRPTLASLGSPAMPLVVVDGCIGARQTEDFREAVSAMGGRAFRSLGVARWSPPLVGATRVDPAELASRLRWGSGTAGVPGTASTSFVQRAMNSTRRPPIGHGSGGISLPPATTKESPFASRGGETLAIAIMTSTWLSSVSRNSGSRPGRRPSCMLMSSAGPRCSTSMTA